MNTEIKGICHIIATPFLENGEVDYVSLENLIKTLIEGGCHAVTLFGIAGEYYKLSDEERKMMVKITVDTCKKYNGKSITLKKPILAFSKTTLQDDSAIINPKILGTTLEISPILIIFSVTVLGAYFGILGMFLAVPVSASGQCPEWNPVPNTSAVCFPVADDM